MAALGKVTVSLRRSMVFMIAAPKGYARHVTAVDRRV
jgi:hypothetical protein